MYSRLLYELKYNWLFHCHPHTLWATFWLFHNLLEHGNCHHIWNWNKNKTMYCYFHYRRRKIYQNCPWKKTDKVQKQSIVKFNWNHCRFCRVFNFLFHKTHESFLPELQKNTTKKWYHPLTLGNCLSLPQFSDGCDAPEFKYIPEGRFARCTNDSLGHSNHSLNDEFAIVAWAKS